MHAGMCLFDLSVASCAFWIGLTRLDWSSGLLKMNEKTCSLSSVGRFGLPGLV